MSVLKLTGVEAFQDIQYTSKQREFGLVEGLLSERGVDDVWMMSGGAPDIV